MVQLSGAISGSRAVPFQTRNKTTPDATPDATPATPATTAPLPMAMAVQYPHTAGAQPPKKTRQRYRRGADDIDTSPGAPFSDPYEYGDYPASTHTATTAALQAMHRDSRHSISLDSAGAPVAPNASRPQPPSYENGSGQLMRAADASERRRSQPSAPVQAQPRALPQPHAPAQSSTAPVGSRNMPTGNALLRQAQAQAQTSGQGQSPGQGQGQSQGQSQNQNHGQGFSQGHSRQAPSQQNASQQSVGASIARLKTPSVMDSVLQPLGQKVQEYNRLMREAQDEMKRLDEELRALQQRRDDAENRFLDAEARHKDWQQQYDSVERTLKGEVPPMPSMPSMPSMPPMPAAAPAKAPEPLPYDESDESDDDHPVHHDRPWSANNQGSFASTKSKNRVRDRLRFSIFGS